jgi:hypothetical protein
MDYDRLYCNWLFVDQVADAQIAMTMGRLKFCLDQAAGSWQGNFTVLPTLLARRA